MFFNAHVTSCCNAEWGNCEGWYNQMSGWECRSCWEFCFSLLEKTEMKSQIWIEIIYQLRVKYYSFDLSPVKCPRVYCLSHFFMLWPPSSYKTWVKNHSLFIQFVVDHLLLSQTVLNDWVIMTLKSQLECYVPWLNRLILSLSYRRKILMHRERESNNIWWN